MPFETMSSPVPVAGYLFRSFGDVWSRNSEARSLIISTGAGDSSKVSPQTKVAPQRRIAMWEVKELVMEKYVHQIPSQRQWDE
jgi:hypothetical protein